MDINDTFVSVELAFDTETIHSVIPRSRFPNHVKIGKPFSLKFEDKERITRYRIIPRITSDDWIEMDYAGFMVY